MKATSPQSMSPAALTISKLRKDVVLHSIKVCGHKIGGIYFSGELLSINWEKQVIEVGTDGDQNFIEIADILDIKHGQLYPASPVRV